MSSSPSLFRAVTAAAAAVLLAASIFAVLTATATADDHRPPGTKLRVGEKIREGDYYTHTWIDGGQRFCSVVHADGVLDLRADRGMAVGAGRHRARIVFLKHERPSEVEVSVYRRLDRHGQPAGHAREKETRLRPRRSGGEIVAWKAVFELRVRAHRYLLYDASWRDRQGCEQAGDQSVSGAFHVRAG